MHSTDSWRVQLLAICLGRFNNHHHFYTTTGKWFASHNLRTRFIVKNFVGAAELQPVVDALPKPDTPTVVLNIMQELKLGPSREVGAGLIEMMQRFQRQSIAAYRANAPRLEEAYTILATKGKPYMSLVEVARALLPKQLRGDQLPSPALLYAVHRILMADDVAFRPLGQASRDRTYLFEISPWHDVNVIRTVEKRVRSFYDQPTVGSSNVRDLFSSALGGFIIKARLAIDHSRKARSWSPHGILGPCLEAQPAFNCDWTAPEIVFLEFMHLWGSHQKFSRSSRLHWAGASILRALDRYQESEYLTASTAWTFLQEVGWIKPWDIQARYSMQLPGVVADRAGGLARLVTGAETNQPGADIEAEDICAGVRKDWTGIPAFAIDAASAMDIDDAVSLERTEKPDEFLIHVHIADPASRIRPDSALARHAQDIPQTAYLPGHFQQMFATKAVRELFSLAPNKPCLTFTARVDLGGAVLSYDITPGTLGEVVYITPEEVASALGRSDAIDLGPTQQPFSVGSPPTRRRQPSKTMTTAAELAPRHLEDLKVLSQLAEALHAERLANGAMPLFWPRPSVEVSFENAEVQATAGPSTSFHCTGDPYISVSYGSLPATRLVESLMRLACGVAAQWCHARGVPAPYRTQPQAELNLAALRAFTEAALYPKLRAGTRPTDAEWRTLAALVGSDDIAADPAPHALMGVPMYAKATSPLRRYADLLLHWQIHAALRGEPAPFSRARLEA